MVGIIMAFDFGTKYIGIAIGQQLTYTTRPLKVLKSNFGIPNWNTIDDIYNEWHPIILIVGLPIKMNGNNQLITILSKQFAVQLRNRFKIKVEMQDERFSTIEARSYYLNNHRRLIKIKKSNYTNAISAAIILNSWLNQHKHPIDS